MGVFDYITDTLEDALNEAGTIAIRGKVVEVVGTMIKAIVPHGKIGEICLLKNPGDDYELWAEIVGFSQEAALLTPLGEMYGLSTSTEVIPTGKSQRIGMGEEMLGRVLDGMGRPMDSEGRPFKIDGYYPVYNSPPSPMDRVIITEPLSFGIRSIDGILTCGSGQRVGVFAAAGGGKSTLLAMITRATSADIVVLALIGERGREVLEFINKDLGPEGMKRAVLVVSTSDRPAMERLKAAYVATAVAEYFRDKGKNVLLMMDSVTRFARALREIGLAAGEPPTRRGFPPSVFASLPKLMERPGLTKKGSITAVYTVLVEGDDMTEPVADETRSILDGHIILSRDLASANHYPAIDVLASISRVMDSIVKPEHKAAAKKLRRLMAKYKEVELLVKIGEYKKGTDRETDEALGKIDAINAFLKQTTDERITFGDTIAALIKTCQ
ncbi:MAG: type III secretion system ATPase SctN [Nitrospirae bacterium]|nr:type III secretion system ATPase SctN [Nitrospirota bacterium]